MKKILLTISAVLLVCIIAGARTISREEAAGYAGKFFNSTNVSLVHNPAADGSTPDFYVFNNAGGGWVIIAGDDAVSPVLGFNHSGSFKSANLPVNIRGHFSRMANTISRARKDGLKQDAKTKLKWENVGVRTKADGQVTLETALWDQSNPFNKLCPTVTGESEKAITGCVATAMGIIMRYNKWPEQGKGTLESYSYKTDKCKTVTINGYSIEEKKYNYSLMPDKKNPDLWSPEEENAVADLLHDCGVMVQMRYSTSGSSASSADVIPALVKHMGYSASARFIYRSSYNESDWFNLLKAEIDEGRPVYYSGQDTGESGGHAFVIDGYDPSGFQRVNWGWGGYDNGWFIIGDLCPTGYRFNKYDAAIFGLAKDPEGTDKANGELAFITYKFPTGEEFSGIKLISGKIEKGTPFSISVGGIHNPGANCTTEVKVCMVGKDGKVKYDITLPEELSLDTNNLTGFTVDNIILDEDPEFGDHISAYQKLHNGEWVIIGGSGDSYMTEYIAQNSLGVVDVPILYVKESYKDGEGFFFWNLIAGQKTILETKWFYDGTPSASGSVTAKKGLHTAKVEITFTDGTTATLEQKIKVN